MLIEISLEDGVPIYRQIVNQVKYLVASRQLVAHDEHEDTHDSLGVRPDLGGVRLPGERGSKALEDARKNGVPLDEGKFRILKKIAEDNGIEPIRDGQ